MNAPKKSLLLIGGLLIGMATANAQYLRSSYFMEGTSSRLQMNPGLQPMRGYVNVPIIGSFNVGAYSTTLGVEDIVDLFGSTEDLYQNDKLYSRLNKNNRMNLNMNTDIFSFGWYRGKGFWSVNWGIRLDVDANVSKDMFDYMRQVYNSNNEAQDLSNYNGSFKDIHLNAKAWSEIGVGYSRPINDKLTVGGRLKVLLGLARAEMKINNFEFNAQYNRDLNGKTLEEINQMVNNGTLNENTQLGTMQYAVDAEISVSAKGTGLKYNSDGGIDKFDFDGGDLGLAGAGFGIDLGATYKVLDNLTLSASVLDLGFINYKGSSTTRAVANESQSETITAGNYEEVLNKYTNSDFLNLERFGLKENQGKKSYKKKLASTILLGGEYTFFDNKLGVGAMYTARFVQPVTMHEVTFSGTYRPRNWFNVALSYSPVLASGKSFGLALKLGPVFLGTDYMYFGDNSRAANAFIGLSIPVGKKKPAL